ncbi:MAG: ubiquitin-activating E1 FCCH domain-containing protein [Patescibacteria group bacterium]
MRNFIPLLTGGGFFRPGWKYINHTRLNKKAFLITFEFNASQSYTLEFTDAMMRVHKGGGNVLETAKVITGITQANPGVVTSTGHGYTTGDEIYIESVVGMTALNGQFFLIKKLDNDTFSLTDIDGADIDTTSADAYVSGGTASKVYEIVSPYAEADLWQLKIAQTADLGYIVHPKYAPYKITRTGHAAWTLATYTRTSDKFIGSAKTITGATQANPGVVTSTGHGLVTGDRVLIESVGGMTQLNGNSYLIVKLTADTFSLQTLAGVDVNTSAYGAYTSGGTAKQEKYPAAVGFYGGRLWMGGSEYDPDVMYGSRGPDSSTGASRYDDFTMGSTATDAVSYTITSQNQTADRIRWFGGMPAFMVVGTSGGVYKANGGSDGAAITNTNISVTPIDSAAAADINPVVVNNQLVYVEQGGMTLRSFEYEILNDQYSAFDKNLLADEVTYPGLTQIVLAQGRPNLVYAVRSDGTPLTCTLISKEEVAGWAGHPVGGDGQVLSISTESQTTGFDKILACVERVIDGKTRRYIEMQATDPYIPDPDDYFTLTSAKAADEQKRRALTFELQKQFVRLDSAAILDTTQNVALTLSALTGDTVTATAGAAAFDADDVGKYIHIKYITGLETGVAKITGYTSSTEVTVQVIQNFLALSIASGGWYLMSKTVRGLGHLEGQTVGVITDGGEHADVVVTDGEITLAYHARYIIVGLRYLGFIRSLDMEFGAQNGIVQGKKRNIVRIFVKLRNTLGGKYGSSVNGLYSLQEMAFRKSSVDYTDRPPMIFTGVKPLSNFDSWAEEKHLYIVQDKALPMTILWWVPEMDVETE